jgi:hypothetical protein
MCWFARIQVLGFAAAGALVALSVAGIPARADEMIQNLGPVGPYEPILSTIGSKRVIVFYEPDGGCDISAVIWNGDDMDANSAAGIRVSLSEGRIAHIDSPENKSLNLQCGDHAATLAVVNGDN